MIDSIKALSSNSFPIRGNPKSDILTRLNGCPIEMPLKNTDL